MKLCEDCKHMRPGGLFCVAPENGISPVDGKPKPLFACVQRLDRSGLAGDLRCGPEAKHFQQKPPERQKRAWWKFWKDTNAAPSNREITIKITYRGVERSVAEWAEITGIPYHTLKARLTRLGYSPEECLEKPVKPGERLEGRMYKSNRTRDSYLPKLTSEQVVEALTTDTPVCVLAQRFGVSPSTIRNARNRTTYRWVNAPC